MKTSQSVETRYAKTGNMPCPAAAPRGLAWVSAGTAECTRPGKAPETLPYATIRDFSRYPAPVLRKLATRLPRRLRAA